MEERKKFDDMKLKQLRADIQAGIASGDAGTLDTDKIKRRGRARLTDARRSPERRYEAGQEKHIDADEAKLGLRQRSE